MARPRKIPVANTAHETAAPAEAHTEMPTETPVAEQPSSVEIECITHNVHLGDGRELAKGRKALVTAELADFLEGRGQVKRV